MIHANELMIGDWVKFPIGNEKIIDLPYIPGKGICASFAASATLFPVEVEKLQPIPLTPEILEKNGLKPDTAEDAYKYCYRIESVSIVECYANAGCRYRFIISFGDTRLRITLMFVHQLQHALRLCGIEKEITI